MRKLAVSKKEVQSTNLRTIALFAARHAARNNDRLVLVEDSGLFIKSLNGFPGPYSSYVYSTVGPEGVLRLMEDAPSRRAHFQSVIAACSSRIQCKTFGGIVNGVIAPAPRGRAGFGFDSIFVPLGQDRTFAEMTRTQKNNHSHRGLCFRRFAKWYMNWTMRKISEGKTSGALK